MHDACTLWSSMPRAYAASLEVKRNLKAQQRGNESCRVRLSPPFVFCHTNHVIETSPNIILPLPAPAFDASSSSDFSSTLSILFLQYHNRQLPSDSRLPTLLPAVQTFSTQYLISQIANHASERGYLVVESALSLAICAVVVDYICCQANCAATSRLPHLTLSPTIPTGT